MDLKEKEVLDRLLKKIVYREFDEIDVYTLLILLRRHGKRGEPLVEFADFVAHREKDRGDIHKYLINLKKKLDRLGTKNEVLEVKSVYKFEEIKKSINSTLKKLSFNQLSDNIISDIVLCIFILLQDVQFVSKKNKNFGYLEIGISEDKISLLGNAEIINNNKKVYCVFPVCELDNSYEKNLPPGMNMYKCLFKLKRNKYKQLTLDLDKKIIRENAHN